MLIFGPDNMKMNLSVEAKGVRDTRGATESWYTSFLPSFVLNDLGAQILLEEETMLGLDVIGFASFKCQFISGSYYFVGTTLFSHIYTAIYMKIGNR